jgi:hypothetical protein
MVSARTPPPSGLSINEHGGYYQDGKPFDLIKKNDVALIYERLKEAGGTVSQRALGRAASVSQGFAAKIIAEVESGILIDPSKVQRERATGAGSLTLNLDDEMLILRLRLWQPAMTLKMYQNLPFSVQWDRRS